MPAHSRPRILAAALQEVGTIEGRRLHVDQDAVFVERRLGDISQLQLFGAPGRADDDRLHSFIATSRATRRKA
jgi:hypothetical protein